MRLSTLFGRTLRDAPSEAESTAHQLVLRAGLARALLAGGYALLPLGMRVARRIEAIMHAELARIGAQEFRTPVVQAAALWEQSGRYSEYGPAMLRFSDRSERALIVAPTHEEAVAELARREVTSYRQLPAIIYQIHTKYRDELRVKGGLMRMREFTMLDAYSLDADDAGLDATYELLAGAFERVFERCGVRYVAVEASAGEMGGREPREYMAISPGGEDTLAICSSCGYAANVEVATALRAGQGADAGAGASSVVSGPMEEVATPDCKTIAELAAFMGVPESATAKAVFFDTPERGLVFVVIRGDLEVNELKLRAATGVSALVPASLEQIAAAGAVPGYASPVGLAVQPTTQGQVSGEAQHERPSGSGVFVIADPSVVAAGPLVAGANHAGYHLRGVVYGRDWQATLVADIAVARAGDLCVRCGSALAFERGIEIGHIFKLGTRFTTALGANFLDAEGAARPVVMGSYGIGVERLLQVIVEQHHDAAGIVWPAEVAPLEVHLVRLGKGEAVRAAADALYGELLAAGVQVLYDDRDESAGVKFNDADLIGLPARLLVSDRLLAAGQVELKPRGGEALKLARGEVLARLREGAS
ncbi:MAG TPA: proline--tRNA ligase [Kouleothrix sp.]|nr:proline--tRNA ligase [Kouleothrix sp.]